jgi:hypothetical protein
MKSFGDKFFLGGICKRGHDYENTGLSKIKRIYRTSRILSQFGKTNYVVDHTIPLKGKMVSGLHIESNLRIITDKWNARKGNKYQSNLEVIKVEGRLS